MRRAAFVLLFILVGVAVVLATRPTGISPQPTAPAQWPTAGWPTAAPEEQGLDSGRLAEALEAIQRDVPNIHSLLAVRNGSLVLDATFYPYDGWPPHDVASVTKSVMTTLIAIAAEQGKLGLDQPVVSFFPDRPIANRDDRKERLTVRHLTSMTAGIDCVNGETEQTTQEMMASADWAQFYLDRPMVAEPGTRFVYCSPGTHLLSAILTEATGLSALEFARQYLFEPLGIEEVNWPADPQGVSHGWGDLRLYPRDAAKIGYLWLSQGAWDGRQIVPSAWVASSVQAQVRTDRADEDYGYGWWVTRRADAGGEYFASGRGGQRIEVLPALDVVIVTTGGGFEPSDATDRLAPALIDPNRSLPANPAGVARLDATIARLLEPPAAGPVPARPAIAARISGQTYRLEPNPLGLTALRLDFDDPAEATLRLTFGEQPEWVLAVGLDGVYRLTPGEFGAPVGCRGTWEDEATFVLEYDEIANREAYLLRSRFDAEQITILAQERTAAPLPPIGGTLIAR